jgi:DNA invertase Pin-like site-specific DNA recombinase
MRDAGMIYGYARISTATQDESGQASKISECARGRASHLAERQIAFMLT